MEIDEAKARVSTAGKNSHALSKSKLKSERIFGVIPVRMAKAPLKAEFTSLTSFYSYSELATLVLDFKMPKTLQHLSTGCLHLYFNHNCYDISRIDISREIKNAVDQEDGTLCLSINVKLQLTTVVFDNILKLVRLDLQLSL